MDNDGYGPKENSSENFATMATWRNDFSSLLVNTATSSMG